MFRGYRRYIFAAFGCLSLAGASPPPQHPQNGQTSQKGQEAPAPAPLLYKAHPNYNEDDCYKNPNHDSADLCAQWRAALAAEKATKLTRWGNWIALIGAILSFAGVVLLVRNLQQAREAIAVARSELEQNKSGLRAWMVGFEPFFFLNKGEDGVIHAMIHVTWRNNGQTPALGAVVVGGPPEREEIFDERRLDGDGVPVTVIGPGQGVPSPPFGVPIQYLYDTKASVKYRSVIRYRDIFHGDIVRTSDFLIEVRYVGNISPALLIDTPGEISGGTMIELRHQQAT